MTAPPFSTFKRAPRALRVAVPVFCLIVSAASAQFNWQRSNGPYTGRILSFLVTSDGALLAGTDKGGIFRSSDGGDNWVYVSLSGSAVYSMLELSDGRLLAGLDFSVQISADKGLTWSKTQLQSVQNAAGLAEDGNGAWYIGSWAGVHKSADGGATWTESMSGLPNISVNDLAVDKAGTLFSAHQNRGLFISRDGAASWASADENLEATTVSSICVAGDGRIFISTMGLGVYRSDDSGATWSEASAGMTKFDISVVHSSDGAVVYAGSAGGRLFRSSDSGANWTELLIMPNAEAITALAQDATGRVFAGTSWAGVLRSADGTSAWAGANTGLINISVPTFAKNDQGMIFMANQAHTDIMMSQDEGLTWSAANGGVYRNTRSLAVMQANGFLYAGTARGVVHSTDNGATWYVDTVRMYNRDVRLLAISPNRNIYASCNGRKLYRSNDYGQNWTLLTEGLGGSEVICFAITPDGAVFAGTESAGLYRSDNNGTTWTNISAGMNRLLVTSLCYSEDYGLFAGSYGEVYHSPDRGATWRRITYNLPVATVNSIVLSNRGNPTVGLEYRGVWYYNPDAPEWTQAIDGLDNSSILAFQATASGKLLAGTDGNGIYISARIPAGAARAASIGAFTLSPVYPNPAVGSGVTIAAGGLTPGCNYAMRITDKLGRTVFEKNIFTEYHEYKHTLPASTLAPGQYYALLQSSSGTTRGASFTVLR